MQLTAEALIDLNNHSNTLELKVIDDVMILNNKTNIDLFTYIINRYPQVSDIHIGFPPQPGNTYKGAVYLYLGNSMDNEGIALVDDNVVTFLMDGFTFKDDVLSKHVLKRQKTNLNSHQDFSVSLNYETFGSHTLRGGMSDTTIALRRVGRRLGDDFKFPHFKYNEYYLSKNNETYYETVNKTNNEDIEKYRIQYISKISELISECNFNKINVNNIKTKVNLETGHFSFHKNFNLTAKEERIFLEYVFNHFYEINTVLYSTIIKTAELFTSKRYKDNIIFTSKEIVKSYMTLTDMATI